MGMEIASKLIQSDADCETRLWRAVINTALEDVMILIKIGRRPY